MVDVCLRIKTLRLSLNLSQNAFAESIGISRNNLSQIEFGAQKPTIDTIIAISNRYKISSDFLLTGEPDIGLGYVMEFRFDYFQASTKRKARLLVELHVGNLFANSTGHYITVIISSSTTAPSIEVHFEDVATRVRTSYIEGLVARVNETDIRWIQRMKFKQESTTQPSCKEVALTWSKSLRHYSDAKWNLIEFIPMDEEKWNLIPDPYNTD